MTQLRDATAVVTGGASGIGRRMAGELADRGAHVVIWDVDQARIDETVMDLQRRGPGKHAGFVCDVTDRAHVFEIAAQTAEAVAPIDVLVNNAGVVSGKWLTDLTEADVRRTFEVNTLAHYWTVQATLPGMNERRRGHIVTIASASAIVGVAKLTDYAASKSAAFAFDESLRVELRRLQSPVKTTVVCPFYIDTGMFKGVKSRLGPLLPILKEDKVAAAVIRAVERDKARLYLPPTVITGHLMRWLPVKAYDAWNDALGVNRSMDDFVGRGGTVRS